MWMADGYSKVCLRRWPELRRLAADPFEVEALATGLSGWKHAQEGAVGAVGVDECVQRVHPGGFRHADAYFAD